MNDKIKINLQMGGISYPLTIDRDKEEIIREAAKQVDIRLNAYRGFYKEVTNEAILGMVAFQFALESLELEKLNDTAPYTHKIKELTDVLETYFKEQRQA